MNFIGSVKEITNEYGSMYLIGITQEDMDKLQEIQPNEKGYKNLVIRKSKKGSWYMAENDYKKGGDTQTTKPKEKEEIDMPF